MPRLQREHIKVFGDFVNESQGEERAIWVLFDDNSIIDSYDSQEIGEQALRNSIIEEAKEGISGEWEEREIPNESSYIYNFILGYSGDLHLEKIVLGKGSIEEKELLENAVKSGSKPHVIDLISNGVNPFLYFKNPTEIVEYFNNNLKRYIADHKEFELDLKRKYIDHIMQMEAAR